MWIDDEIFDTQTPTQTPKLFVKSCEIFDTQKNYPKN
jgi:hypothetical protein